LLDPGRKVSNEQEGVSIVSKSLKACAKELETSVVALAQLNRNNEGRQDKRPILSDLRSSGQLEQDADVVTAIHRDAYYRPDDEDVKGLAELLILKQRNGSTGVIKLAFQAEIVRFDNLARGV
jgi:replicative DNA helicase